MGRRDRAERRRTDPLLRKYRLIDARHPQKIIAYGLNGAPLPIPNGAPFRVRVERQLGYKMAKYVHRIELVETYADIGRGKKSYWADRGYEWYAGIFAMACHTVTAGTRPAFMDAPVGARRGRTVRPRSSEAAGCE